jgi:hypothetical protein
MQEGSARTRSTTSRPTILSAFAIGDIAEAIFLCSLHRNIFAPYRAFHLAI